MINIMTKQQKDDFIFFNAAISACEFTSLDYTEEEKEQIQIAKTILLMVLESYVKRCTRTLAGELLKTMKVAKVHCTTPEMKVKTRQVQTVETKDLDYIIEASLETCANCKRNWKQCGLRKALHKVGAPMIDSDQPGCKFRR